MESQATASAPARSNLRLLATVLSLGIFVGGFIAFAAWNGTWYQTWKALHVLAAIVWVGGGVMIQLLALRIMRANDPAQLAKFANDVEAVSLRAFIPASLVLLALGFVLIDRAAGSTSSGSSSPWPGSASRSCPASSFSVRRPGGSGS